MSAWPKEVMLAKTYEQKRVKDWESMVIEPKLDGVRCIILYHPKHGIRFHSRNGREWFMFKKLELYVEAAHMALVNMYNEYKNGTMFDGEIVCSSFANSAGTIHRKNYQADDAVFHCFHVMPIDYFYGEGDEKEQGHRKEQLKALSAPRNKHFKLIEPREVEDHDHALRLNREHVGSGYEGSIIKDLSKPWVPTRSHAWMKIKEEISVDVQVTDLKEGSGKYEGTLGALVVRYKKRNVNVSGMTDKQRDTFWKERFSKNTIIGRTVEVQCQLITEKGSLRHPRFKRIRDDK